MMKYKRRPSAAVFCILEVSIQHSVFTCRHFPDDSWCHRSFYDPSSEYFRILGFQSEYQRDDHFEVIPFDDVSISAARAVNNAVFMQNAAFEYHSDIRVYGSREYSEQIGDLALREPYSVGGCANRYTSVFDCYGLSCHIRLILYRFS